MVNVATDKRRAAQSAARRSETADFPTTTGGDRLFCEYARRRTDLERAAEGLRGESRAKGATTLGEVVRRGAGGGGEKKPKQ